MAALDPTLMFSSRPFKAGASAHQVRAHRAHATAGFLTKHRYLSLLASGSLGIVLIVLGLSGGCIQASIPPRSGQPQAAAPTATAQPHVWVTDVQLTASADGSDRYQLQAVIQHDTPGGRADVTVRLRDPGSGVVVATRGGVDLKPGVALAVVYEIVAPRAAYEPEVEVAFPAR